VTALAGLRSRGLFLGVITNGAGDTHPDSQRTKAESLQLLGRVDGFWVSDEMGYRKPDPWAFLPALQVVGASAEDCLFVGDSLEADIAGANAAGMRSALIMRRAGPRLANPLSGARPWRVIHSLWQTLDLLEDDGPQALSN
jgi:putative hydrolase of the HAD superfamily